MAKKTTLTPMPYDFDASAKSGCVRVIVGGKERALYFDISSATTIGTITGIGKMADEFQKYLQAHPIQQDEKGVDICAYDDTAKRLSHLCEECSVGFRKIFGQQFDETFGKGAVIDDLDAVKYFVSAIASQISVMQAESKAAETAEGEV